MTSLVLIRVYNSLGDYAAAERQAAAALAAPDAAESVKAVLVPGARALASYELGNLDESAEAAKSADSGAQRLGFDQHFFAVDHLRALSGLAAERRDFDAAERYTERVLSIAEQRRPLFEFLALLDRARIWAARGLVRDALATIETARKVASQASAVLLAQADELEALLRLSLGDLRSPPELARHLTAARRNLLLARVALAAGDHQAAQALLREAQQGELTPRQELVHRLLLSAIAIERGDPAAPGMLGGALHTARHQGFLNTVITTAPQLAEYVVEHAAELRSDPFTDQLVVASIELRGTQLRRVPPGQPLAEPLTAAERRTFPLAHQYLPADGGHAPHLAQHGEDTPEVDLSETGGDVTPRGAEASRRPAPALGTSGIHPVAGDSPGQRRGWTGSGTRASSGGSPSHIDLWRIHGC